MKERLDVLLVKRNMAESREKAKAIIMSGNVFVEGQREDKAGSTFPEEVEIEIKGNTLPYVSRGGLKLEKAVFEFHLDLKDKVCTDVGSSTGGFTDCMLQNGAKKVYAIDVGRGQPFISLTKVLSPIKDYLKEDGRIVALIKPQFEAGREKVGKKGVVREKSTHVEVIDKILEYAHSIGFSILGLTFSPIKGPEGNIEYLVYLKKEEKAPETDRETILDVAKKTVEEAFGALAG